jgi:flagellar protein FlbD
MIEATDLHGHVRYINAELIESIESNPDTQIVLNNGHRYYTKESAQTIAERVLEYRRRCLQPPEFKQESAAPE